MNLQEIAYKYRVSDSYLNSKEDALMIVSKSIQDLINELNGNKIDESKKQSIIEKLDRLSNFCKDVKHSTF